MKIDDLFYDGSIWSKLDSAIADQSDASVVFIFGHSDEFKQPDAYESLAAMYPSAQVVGVSSSGNIAGIEISGQPIVATAVQLEKGRVVVEAIDFSAGDDVEAMALELVNKLPAEGLRHIFLLSDGLNINGSELVRGINKAARGVPVSGGMAGDGDRFQETWVVANAPARQFRVALVGFYGEDLVISTSYNSGWSSFGPQRRVTRSQGNVLYELDGKPALQLYKDYLGDYARDLPLSGMRFPLNIKADEGGMEVTRTLLAIDEESSSITFAGDVPEGYIARLMKPNLSDLIEGAGHAAKTIVKPNNNKALGLVVSCVGRRVVMDQMIEDELEELQHELGDNVSLSGFYSYGEFSPFHDELKQCQLHNQTITLTTVYEQ